MNCFGQNVYKSSISCCLSNELHALFYSFFWQLWNTKHRKDLVVPSCKKTLADLGLECLDLYLIHWPMGYKEGDVLGPMDEATGQFIASDADFLDTWKEMESCVKQGLTKSIGVSNFNSQQIQRILDNCTIKPVVNQVWQI